MKIWTAALVVASFLVMPTLARAEGGVEIGALGGAMAGSLMGPGSDRVEHAVIGAVVGALLGAAIDAEEQSRYDTTTSSTWSEPEYVATYPTTRYVIAEPVHYREKHRWDRHRHHHHRDRHRHHHRHNHWRNWD
ncbi:MAG: glycine zipper domain-containing protein [Magnetococcus sp. YQC-3]